MFRGAVADADRAGMMTLVGVWASLVSLDCSSTVKGWLRSSVLLRVTRTVAALVPAFSETDVSSIARVSVSKSAT